MQSEHSDRSRTCQQNKALHKYFREVAHELGAAGHDPREVIKVPMTFTDHIVKDEMAKPIMRAMFGKESTTELTVEEIRELVQVLQRLFAEKFGVVTPFPSKEES